MGASRLRQLVRENIEEYFSAISLIEYGYKIDLISKTEILRKQIRSISPDSKLDFFGTEIDQYAQAIQTLNQFLDNETEGREEFIY